MTLTVSRLGAQRSHTRHHENGGGYQSPHDEGPRTRETAGNPVEDMGRGKAAKPPKRRLQHTPAPCLTFAIASMCTQAFLAPIRFAQQLDGFQHLVYEGHHNRSFADGRCHTLDVTAPHVANGEHARQ
jgi:hypothetical protein